MRRPKSIVVCTFPEPAPSGPIRSLWPSLKMAPLSANRSRRCSGQLNELQSNGPNHNPGCPGTSRFRRKYENFFFFFFFFFFFKKKKKKLVRLRPSSPAPFRPWPYRTLCLIAYLARYPTHRVAIPRNRPAHCSRTARAWGPYRSNYQGYNYPPPQLRTVMARYRTIDASALSTSSSGASIAPHVLPKVFHSHPPLYGCLLASLSLRLQESNYNARARESSPPPFPQVGLGRTTRSIPTPFTVSPAPPLLSLLTALWAQ